VKKMDFALTIFAYNRPDHLKECLASIELNDDMRLLDVYIFIDGPANHDAKASSEHVLDIAKEFAQTHPNCVVSYSDRNLGLRQSIISALSALFSKYEGIIIVEDDLVVSRDFIQFMIKMLIKFANDKKIGSISGFAEAQFPLFVPSDLIAARRQSCWGWATWSDRWNSISWDDSELDSNELKTNVSLLSSIGWDLKQIYKAQIAGNISSWAIHFDTHAARNQWRSLQPRYTLVRNNGMDGSGTHFTSNITITKPLISGYLSKNSRTDSYSISKVYDAFLRLKHSHFSNLIIRILTFIKLRINSKS
jgi:hypothetical protein